MMKRLIVVGLALVMGCSDDSNGTTPPATDGGTNGGKTAKFSGQLEGYSSKGPVADVDVEAGGVKGKTNSKGVFELAMAKDTAFNLVAKHADYFTLVDQEMKVSVDADLPKLRFVDKQAGGLLLSALKIDPAKGIVSVGLKATSSCTGKAADFPAGAKVTVEGQADAKVIYYKSTPNPSLTEAQAEQDPAAIIVGAAPDQELKVKVEYSKCSLRAWPVTEGDITFTGKITPKAPETLSVYRVFYE